MKSFFITASGTGIGKTVVTAALAWQLHQAGKKVMALKPIISGYDPDDGQSDTALLLKSIGFVPSNGAKEAISPWRFAAPLSPDMAAEKEGKPPVDFEKLVEFCRAPFYPLPLWEGVGGGSILEKDISLGSPPSLALAHKGGGDYLLVEGVGGIMTPINHQHTVLDWVSALGWPVIMVTGSYLGAISHTLTSMEALRSKGLSVKALAVSESESGVLLDDTVATLKKFLLPAVPVVKIPRIAASGDVWKHVPPISGICA